MTEQGIKDSWLRFMHRADLASDIDATWPEALTRCRERLLFDVEDADLIEQGRMLRHAGLCYLQELAQDDEGLAREERLFENAAGDFAIWFSRSKRKTVDPFTYANADEEAQP